MSKQIALWGARVRNNKWLQDREHNAAIDSLQSLFEGKTDPKKTATDLAFVYHPLLKQEPSLKGMSLWTMLCEAILILGSDTTCTTRLVRLIDALGDLPDVINSAGEPARPSHGYSGVFWRDLPALGISLRVYAFEWYSLSECNVSKEVLDEKFASMEGIT